jgi:hypothetical protein
MRQSLLKNHIVTVRWWASLNAIRQQQPLHCRECVFILDIKSEIQWIQKKLCLVNRSHDIHRMSTRSSRLNYCILSSLQNCAQKVVTVSGSNPFADDNVKVEGWVGGKSSVFFPELFFCRQAREFLSQIRQPEPSK